MTIKTSIALTGPKNDMSIDAAALVMLVENNWYEFVEYSGGEESAELTLLALKNAAGMDA